jgi:methionyl-tRNA synthetase
MYVWYDALANYVTALDILDENGKYLTYWTECPRRIHVIGKGINRFHTLYWPAMLMSAGMPVPTEVFVHGYLTINSQKISKSLGNVIDPMHQVEHYGTDPVRYYLLRALSPFEDGDYSESRFEELYNADLANNLGNLARRIETIGAKAGFVPDPTTTPDAPAGYHEAMADWRFNDAVASIWSVATTLNQEIETVKPWELQKNGRDEELGEFLERMIVELRRIAHWLEPFMPETASRIQWMFRENEPIERSEPLFPRLVT